MSMTISNTIHVIEMSGCRVTIESGNFDLVGRVRNAVIDSLCKEIVTDNNVTGTYLQDGDTLKGIVIRFMQDNPNSPVHAIKKVRELTGWGLKEAKLYCDKLRGNDMGGT